MVKTNPRTGLLLCTFVGVMLAPETKASFMTPSALDRTWIESMRGSASLYPYHAFNAKLNSLDPDLKESQASRETMCNSRKTAEIVTRNMLGYFSQPYISGTCSDGNHVPNPFMNLRDLTTKWSDKASQYGVATLYESFASPESEKSHMFAITMDKSDTDTPFRLFQSDPDWFCLWEDFAQGDLSHLKEFDAKVQRALWVGRKPVVGFTSMQDLLKNLGKYVISKKMPKDVDVYEDYRVSYYWSDVFEKEVASINHLGFEAKARKIAQQVADSVFTANVQQASPKFDPAAAAEQYVIANRLQHKIQSLPPYLNFVKKHQSFLVDQCLNAAMAVILRSGICGYTAPLLAFRLKDAFPSATVHIVHVSEPLAHVFVTLRHGDRHFMADSWTKPSHVTEITQPTYTKIHQSYFQYPGPVEILSDDGHNHIFNELVKEGLRQLGAPKVTLESWNKRSSFSSDNRVPWDARVILKWTRIEKLWPKVKNSFTDMTSDIVYIYPPYSGAEIKSCFDNLVANSPCGVTKENAFRWLVRSLPGTRFKGNLI